MTRPAVYLNRPHAMIKTVLVAALSAVLGFHAPFGLPPAPQSDTPEVVGVAFEDPCDGCHAEFATAAFMGGGCTVTLNIAKEDGECVGKRPLCSVEALCKFVTQPLCDSSCCVTQFQDSAGNWNTVLCGQTTGIWLHPCQTLATSVNWRVIDACANPPALGFGAAVYQCTPCD